MKLPQLSLRDLLWLVALVAMGCGWWVEHRRAADYESRWADLSEAWDMVVAHGDSDTRQDIIRVLAQHHHHPASSVQRRLHND